MRKKIHPLLIFSHHILFRSIAVILPAMILIMDGCNGSTRGSLTAGKVRTSPPMETAIVGYSNEDRPIKIFVFGRGHNAVLIIGGIHGDEPTGHALAQRLVELLKVQPEIYRDRCIVILPAANPDGLASKRRTNANQIDLNRNFPSRNWQQTRKNKYFGGDRSAGEPETRAIMDTVELYQPVRILSLHSISNGRHGNNFDGPGGEELAELMCAQNGYRLIKNMGYPTPGSLGSWVGTERKIPIITLELPRNLDADRAWAENREALLAFIRVD